MYQAYDRPKTPTRFNTTQQNKTIETSPFKEGKPNNRYANPSMVSNDVFYEKHYDNPDKQLTPSPLPLGIPSKGYGKMNDYKDRYKQIAAQADQGSKTPRSNNADQKDLHRSNLRDNHSQRSGVATPTRSHHDNRYANQASGARTPTRRADPQVADLRASGHRTPSDYEKTHSHGQRTPHQHGAGHSHHEDARRTPTRSQLNQGQRFAQAGQDHEETRSQKSHPSQQSDASRLTNAELICDNCINKHMIDDKRDQAKNERLREEQYNKELQAKERAHKQREDEENMRRKEKFRQEAIDHWEESKRIKAQQKDEEKKNEEAMRGLFYDREQDEKQAKYLADKRRQQLRDDLKNQIKDKRRLDEQTKRELDEIPNTGLPIGQDYVNRYERFRDAHKAALKEQIDEKSQQKQNEKEQDKKHHEQLAEDMKNYTRAEQQRKEQADQARKEHYRKEMERFLDEKESKRRKDDDEKARDLENEKANKYREREEEDKKKDALKRREESHLAALKDQMDEAARRRKLEEEERKKYQIPAFKTEKVCKLYDCQECHQKYPPTQLNKVRHEHNDRVPEPDMDY